MENNIMIDTGVLQTFAVLHNNDKIGTLSSATEEVQACTSLVAGFFYLLNLYTACKHPENFDYLRNRRLLIKAAEMSDDEVERLRRRMMRKLQTASKKIVWLSTKANELTGAKFVTGYVNLNDPNSCLNLVREFYAAPIIAEITEIA